MRDDGLRIGADAAQESVQPPGRTRSRAVAGIEAPGTALHSALPGAGRVVEAAVRGAVTSMSADR